MNPENEDDVIIRSNETSQLSGFSRSEVFRKARDPKDPFPAPIRLSPHAVGWLKTEVLAWRARRPRAYSEEDK